MLRRRGDRRQWLPLKEQVDSIFATCPQGRPTSDYRDMLARFSSRPPAQESVPAFFTAPPEKMRDHILSCSGGTVHSGSGYRDMLWRCPADNRRPVVAGRLRSRHAQLVAP